MKPIKTFLFVSLALVVALVAFHQAYNRDNNVQTVDKIPVTSYGAFLAAQHALYTNDFDRADEFLDSINDSAKGYKT